MMVPRSRWQLGHIKKYFLGFYIFIRGKEGGKEGREAGWRREREEEGIREGRKEGREDLG